MTSTPEIRLRPALAYAVMKISPLILLSLTLLWLAWNLSPCFVGFSFAVLLAAGYRLLYIRSLVWLITPEELKISSGILFKRADRIEMYRIKDYIITQSFLLQLFRLMTLTLKSTDAETPVVQLPGICESEIIDIIREHVQQARKNNHIYEIN